MALTLDPASTAARTGRLRRTVTGPVPVLVAASGLATVFLVLVADLVAKLG